MQVRLISGSIGQVLTSDGVHTLDLTGGAEELILYCAKVSNPAGQNQPSPKLLQYLVKNNHWSPFEMADMTVEIETSRAIAQQILRHRSFSFQEFSQRYADPTQLGFETYEARRQDTKDRQNSIDDMDEEARDWFRAAQRHAQDVSTRLYKVALDYGIAKEQARFLLPQSTTSRLYMKGSCRSWIHYLQVRALDVAGKTQKEHKDIAREILLGPFKTMFPQTYEAVFGG